VQDLLLGKEVYIFFGQYELCGILGLIISGGLTAVIINKVLQISNQNKINTYNNFLTDILKNKQSRINLIQIINYIVNIFLLISFYIMIAGFVSFFKQEYNLSPYIIVIITTFMCYIILSKNIEGVIKISTICVPIIILVIVNIGLKNFEFGIEKITSLSFNITSLGNSIISAILYASYNSILLIPVIISLRKYVKSTKRNIRVIGMIIFVIFITLGILVYMILLKGNIQILQLDMPLVYIVESFGKIYEYLFGIVIIISIFTSIISSGYSFLENVSSNKKKYNIYLILICISAIFISNIGFSRLVNLLYPIFGILGTIQIYYILKRKT
jgi:uncharacterized membrane protein YkvI